MPCAAAISPRGDAATKLSIAVAGLRAAVEVGVPPGDGVRAVSKLVGVENAWQTLEEAKAERAEVIKGAKDGDAPASCS